MKKLVEPSKIFKKHTDSDTMNKDQFRSAIIEVLSMFVKVEDLANTNEKQKSKLVIS